MVMQYETRMNRQTSKHNHDDFEDIDLPPLRNDFSVRPKANRISSANLKSGSISRLNTGKKIFAESIDTKEDFVPPFYPKSDETIQFLNNAFIKSVVLNNLNVEQRRTLVGAMCREYFPKGSGIIQQGDKSDFFYVVEDGIIEFYVNWKDAGKCGPGDLFGELALLYDCPRAASCIAGTNCILWKVDMHTFRHILTKCESGGVEGVCKILKRVPCLYNLDKKKLIEMIQACTTEKYRAGKRISSKGQVGWKFHIIREGEVKIHDMGFKKGQRNYVDYILRKDDFFCERALWSASASTSCTTLALSLDTYEKVLGSYRELINCLVKRHMLMGIPIFANSKLTPHQISCLADEFTKRTYLDGEVLIKPGSPVVKQGIYIIQKGIVVIEHEDGSVVKLSRGDYFGDSFLQAEEGSASKICIAIEKQAVCSVLTKGSIESVIGSVSSLVKPLPTVSNLDMSIKFHDIEQFRIIGVGSFSTVRLSRHKNSFKPYAIKIISKYKAAHAKKADGIIREKKKLSSLDHPFIVKLVSTFQDDYNLYLLLEFVHGGELFKIIHSQTSHGIPAENARFYAACILEALSHLHHHHICYRNLIPENILIDRDGYCKLVNFKYAKVVSDKTYTFCGTPGYLAPEIILCKGHNKNVDCWALGVLIYEMLMGANPFFTNGMDQVTLFKRIVKAKYFFPLGGQYCESTEQLIGGLLARKQTNRLGHLAGVMDIKRHAWFAFIDFAKILRKEVPPPWVPKIKGDLDPSYFDTYDDLEYQNQFDMRLSMDLQGVFQEF